MHSSRMCTIRNSSRLGGGGGVCTHPRGVCTCLWGVPARGEGLPALWCTCPGDTFQGVTCRGGGGGGVPAGVGVPAGGYLPRGVYLPGGVLAQVLPCEQNDRQV